MGLIVLAYAFVCVLIYAVIMLEISRKHDQFEQEFERVYSRVDSVEDRIIKVKNDLARVVTSTVKGDLDGK